MIYLFENYSLDSDRRELRREGTLVAVEPRAFDLLLYLVRNRDHVVSKDDLIAKVWQGRIVSDSALTSRMNAARNAVGDNGAQQRLIRTVARKGHRFVGEVHEEERALRGRQAPVAPTIEIESTAKVAAGKPVISFVRTPDNTNLAVASVGRGPVLMRAAHWVTHIEGEWQSPLTAPVLHRLASRFRLIFYDGRGAGLSDRKVKDMSFGSYRDDLDAVIDSMKLKRFALLGMSGGAALAIAYAARHPHRVSKLVLYGGYALGRNKRGSPQSAEEANAFVTMIRSAWSDADSPFWRAFSSFYLPNATSEQIKSFRELHSMALSLHEGMPRARLAVDEIDVCRLLPKIKVPTIIFHPLRDRLVPFEQGRLLATSIPNAKFVPLDSENHTLLSDEPAWQKFIGDVEAFLAEKD